MITVATTTALLLLVVVATLSGNDQELPWHTISSRTSEGEAATRLEPLEDHYHYSLPMNDENVVSYPSKPARVVAKNETVTSERRSLLVGEETGDRSIPSLKRQFQIARAELESQLKVDYGEEAYSMLFQTSDQKTRVAYKSPTDDATTVGPSWNRMVRRLMKKIVKSQLENRNLPFIWSTGGHSGEATFCLLLFCVLD
jgi:hypothetical protein